MNSRVARDVLEEGAWRWAEPLRRLLQATAALPWAPLARQVRLAGVPEWLARQQLTPLALRLGLVEIARVPGPSGKPPVRLGLTPGGAARVGASWERAALQDALLRSRHLDIARRVLVDLTDEIEWCRSPYTVPAAAVRRASSGRMRPARVEPGQRLLKVPLDVLAAVTRGSIRCHVAILVDPGELDIAYLARLWRSLYAWRARPEWRRCPRGFPMLIVLAANAARRIALLRAWQQAAQGRVAPLRLGLIGALAETPVERGDWLDERGQTSGLWPAAGGLQVKTMPPSAAATPWWGGLEAREAAQQIGVRGLLAEMLRPTATDRALRGLIGVHLHLSARARWLLEILASFPLLSGARLAVVMGVPASQISVDLVALAQQALIEQEPDGWGWHLSWRGVQYLAAQVGLSAVRYAESRRWALAAGPVGWRLSLATFTTRRAHTELALQFLVGLRQHGPRAGLEVLAWEFLQVPVQAGEGPRLRQLVPDGAGRLRLKGSERSVWLEIDRGTVQGRALDRKLARYYLVDGPGEGRLGHGTRIWIVTSDEGRLRSLQRRLCALDARYRTRLDVRLARVDQLQAGRDSLDPLRPVWRAADRSDFVTLL